MVAWTQVAGDLRKFFSIGQWMYLTNHQKEAKLLQKELGVAVNEKNETEEILH